MIQILPLDRAQYAGKAYATEIFSDAYLVIEPRDGGFSLHWEPSAQPIRMPLSDTMLSGWLEDPVAYGAFEGDRLCGFVEGFLERWNNRFRITNLCIFDPPARRKGLGSLLMDRICADARSSGARMVVLETQSFNAGAVSFYQKHGFALIGFDLFAYSNQGPDEHNVRLEMGKAL